MIKSFLTANVLVVGMVFGLVPVGASADENDPPSRVARIGYLDGSVSIQPAGTQDWVQAPINRPLTTGDVVWSDQGSRSELQLDASIVRLADSTELTFLNLGDEITQLQLSSGTVMIRVRRLDDRETYEVDTPNLAFTILRPGVYRISVDTAGNTSVTVRSGQGEASGSGSAYSVYAGNADFFSGSDQLAAEALPNDARPDGFDTWCEERDARWEHSNSARYLSPDVIGFEDLDDQGSWRSSSDYGYVWYPNRVDAGWAPYHQGHWSYIAPWGYTWVDDQPWGFAPFHYGRWLWTNGGWGWIPGPSRPVGGPFVRPVYAPALVAWVGGGVGAGIAWFALGPREVYVPSYPVSATYVRNINVSNTTVTNTVINNVYNTTVINNKTVNVTYVNRAAPGAIAATSTQAFTSAAPVARNRVEVDPHAYANAPVHALAPTVVPTKQAVLGSTRVASARPPASVATRAVVVRTAPPAQTPTIDQRLKAIKDNGGKPLSVDQSHALQSPGAEVRTAAIRVAPPVAPVNVTRDAQKANPPGSTANDRPLARAPSPPEMPLSHPAPSAVHVRELPIPPKPASPSSAASALEREHLQQQQQLAAQQAQERSHVHEQQEREHQQAAKQRADAANEQAHERQQAAAQAAVSRNAAQAQQRSAQEKAESEKNQEIERQHQLQTQQLQRNQIDAQQKLQAQQREQHKAQNAGRQTDEQGHP